MGNKGSVNSELTMDDLRVKKLQHPLKDLYPERRAMTVTARERHLESPVGGRSVGGFERRIEG